MNELFKDQFLLKLEISSMNFKWAKNKAATTMVNDRHHGLCHLTSLAHIEIVTVVNILSEDD